MKKLIRITTVPLSLEKLLENQLSYFSSYFAVVAISSDGEELSRIGREQGVQIYVVDMTRQITPLKDLYSLWKLLSFLRREKPHIVHTHTPKAGIIGMLAAKLAGVPHRLHTVAGLPLLETKGVKRNILNFVERLTYACATRVYPNSHGLLEIILKENFCNERKLKLIGNGSSNGINTEYFDPLAFSIEDKTALRKSIGIAEDNFVFVFAGRLVGDKGVNELVEAYIMLTKNFKDTKLLLIGGMEQDLDPLYPETIEIIKLHPDIIATGYLQDIRLYLAISDILTFPSYREGFPNVVMQAGAMELPAIVTNINGCNEIIVDGVNGIIVPVKDSKQLYLAMKSVLINQELRLKLKSNARERIRRLYDQKTFWSLLLDEYLSLE